MSGNTQKKNANRIEEVGGLVLGIAGNNHPTPPSADIARPLISPNQKNSSERL
jgi:hypothetical protein